jgi:hypothetical protein
LPEEETGGVRSSDSVSHSRWLCPEKGVWNFQALKTPAFIEAGEFQHLFWTKPPTGGSFKEFHDGTTPICLRAA